MRLTIERLRTLVLVAGALLVIALVAFLAVARWKSHYNLRDIPRQLGANIERQADGFVYTQANRGHTLFKIHASKLVQLKQDGRALLHDVQIELYGDDGARVDRIAGNEFEYDQKSGKATAAGPVEITLMRPGEAPAVAPKAAAGHPSKASPLTNMAQVASQGEIHVKTSGLTFDQKSGVATTSQRVEFAIAQGNGSSIGATFDSQRGELLLDHSVQLDVSRGPEKILMRAQHAEFERDNLLCRLHTAWASFRGGEASAGDANLLFRPDGTAVRLDASDGFSVTTATAAHIAAPRGTLEFGDHNQPQRGRLEGGATMDSSANGRTIHGSAPAADFAFSPQGDLQSAHLERGVTMHTEQTSLAQDADSGPLKIIRDWRSPVADLEFHPPQQNVKGQVQLASVSGTGGVVITSQTQRGNGLVIPSRMAADQVTATFGDGQELTSAVGTGHASLEQMTSSGAKQTTSGDRIQASFAPGSTSPVAGASGAPVTPRSANVRPSTPRLQGSGNTQIQSATVTGNVVLVQEPATKAGAPPPAALRATAGQAVYEGAGEWLHLTGNPRIDDGALQLSADKVDVAQASGDAFARGNVKATWLGSAASRPASEEKQGVPGPSWQPTALGGQGPAHVIAAEAQLHQATGEATFRGRARLWQQANSISAPVIVLNRDKQTLVASSPKASDPVRLVLLSAGGTDLRRVAQPASPAVQGPAAANVPRPSASTPSVIRVRGGDLKYSEAERKAVMHGVAAGSVIAESASATSVSDALELVLLPPANHAGKDGAPAQVDRMIATGRVTLTSEGRRGTGQRLEYSSDSGQYVLTGTPSDPPQLTDEARGTVTGESLIFNSRDDSVSIEGGGHKTSTATTAPR